jgi:hypothetical protein
MGKGARDSEAFRDTLRVAALAYGFNTDMRPTFRRLRSRWTIAFAVS